MLIAGPAVPGWQDGSMLVGTSPAQRKASSPGGGISPTMLRALLCEKEVWYLSNKVLATEAGGRKGAASWTEAGWNRAGKTASEGQAAGCSGREAGLS